jgi:hypothetical protein
MRNQNFMTAVLCAVAISGAHAQGRHAVAPMPPGYACMRLNLPPGTLYEHRDMQVPVLAAPSPGAKVIGPASEVVVVSSPQQPENGFLRVVITRQSTGWIDARYLRPWNNPYAPKARCIPSIMSDGSIGTHTVN